VGAVNSIYFISNTMGWAVGGSGSILKTTDGGANWSFNTEAAVANANVTIKNASGQVVYTETGSLDAGNGSFLWDGKGSDGNTQPDGLYTISIDGTDLSGRNVNVTTSSTGVVTGVDFSGSEPMLTVGNQKMALKDVTSVKLVS
jgi:flagellar basal-body rod modification protein FlgD